MDAYLLEWLGLLGRWLHVVVGIAWIGASFYFVWLDNHLHAPTDAALLDKGVGGELWAVHGGGFYNPQKYRLAPARLPQTLHWFYWEAYSTWLSGFFLLCLLYYLAPETYLINPAVAPLGRGSAVGLGLLFLVGGWLVYDGLCRSPLVRDERLLTASLALVLGLAAFGLCSLFSGRGAYIHFGAMLGTLMVGNVFFVIIPGQRAMVAAASAGLAPDPAAALRARQRSVHNTYFTLPVLLTMISNHYAMTYGAPHNAAALVGLSLGGAAIRLWFVQRHKARDLGGQTPPLALAAGVLSILLVAWTLRPAPRLVVPGAAASAPDFAAVQAIIQARCASCHAEHPTQPGFVAAPKGRLFDTPSRIASQRADIRQQVSTRAMPVGNLTHMTEAERATVLAWTDAGSPP
ncbi:MAG: urate hydroxylase PuuD [Panacagrimonas sp.]